MEAKFEKAFLKGVRKHAGIKKQIEQKVRQIMELPVEIGEPLRGNCEDFTPALSNVTSLSSIYIVPHVAKRASLNL